MHCHDYNPYKTKREIWFVVMFVAFMLWQLPGIFPAISYEGDALSICAGCEYTFNNGWSTLGERGYGYWMQPLTFVWIITIKHLLPTLGCEEIYSLSSGIAAIGMQLLAVIFAARVTEIRKEVILLTLILLPESYALAMYPNSATLSGVLYMAGILTIVNKQFIPAVILLTLAPLFRLDVVIAYPIIPLLLRYNGMSWKRSLLISIGYAITLIIFTFTIYKILGADVMFTAKEHSRWSNLLPFRKNIIAIFGFYGVSIIGLLIISLIILIRKKENTGNRFIIISSWAIVILVHLIQLRFGNASKHFAMLIPYVTIIASSGLRWLIDRRRNAKAWILILIIVASQISGVRIERNGNEVLPQTLLNDFNPTLASIPISTSYGDYTFVIGGGQPAMTADEAILTSGNFFYSIFIHNLKENNIRRREVVMAFLGREKNATAIFTTWEEESALMLMQERGEIGNTDINIDKELANYTERIENSQTCEEMSKYLTTKYSDHANPIYFVNTEGETHRWRTALNRLQKKGLIERLDNEGAIWQLKQ